MSSLQKIYNVHQAIALIEDDTSTIRSADIFIQPPGDGTNSDEDSGDEEINGGNLNNLSKKQLLADADIRIELQSGEELSLQSNDHTETEPKSPQPSPVSNNSVVAVESNDLNFTRFGKSEFVPSTPAQWRKVDISNNVKCKKDWQERTPEFLVAAKSPTTIFEWFFDEEIVNLIVTETNRYAIEKGDHNFQTTPDEIHLYVAILYLSGYASLPRRNMYWELKPDVHNEAVSEAMSRNQFNAIMKYLHLANNNVLPPHDKFAKVRKLFDLVNQRCLRYFPMEQNLSVDESRIPYFGRHGAKQCIRNKPIRFGFKSWVLATAGGYVVQLDPYQGASGSYVKSNGLGYSVVTSLLSCLPEDLPITVTFDNFFTTLKLLFDLAEAGIGAIGTIRPNRLHKCPIMNADDLKKLPRGSYDYRYDNVHNTIIVAWNDNSVVTLGSNSHGVLPIQKAQRFSARDKSHIQIDQPDLIKTYNSTMGRVDRMDQNIGCYRINMRTKKWWWPLFAISSHSRGSDKKVPSVIRKDGMNH